MSKMKRLVFAVLFFIIPALPVCAQFSIGARAGVLYHNNHYSGSTFVDDNSLTRFSGGLITEYMFAYNRFGFDLSLMYSRRGKNMGYEIDPDLQGPGPEIVFTRDYIDVPVNFIWKITRHDLLNPYLFSGPMFGFNISDNKKSNVAVNPFVFSWNFGVGVEIIKMFRVSYTYSLGISNSEGSCTKDRGSLFTVGYLFTFKKRKEIN